MNIDFKPPMNYFPYHVTRIPPFSVALCCGFDQGNLMWWGIEFFNEDGHMVMFAGGGETWQEALPNYFEYIHHARWLAEGNRYIKLREEHQAFMAKFYREQREKWIGAS